MISVRGIDISGTQGKFIIKTSNVHSEDDFFTPESPKHPARIPSGFVHFHADDFGMTLESSDRIRACWEKGALMGVSLMPNGAIVRESAGLAAANVGVCVHINLVEGPPVSPCGDIPMLVNENGMFGQSFEGVFFKSLGPGRSQFKEQVYREVHAQIKAVMSALPEGAEVGIDSHQHTHMIPLVFDQMVRALDDLNVTPAYVRFAAEPLSPGFSCPEGRKNLSAINIVKAVLLKTLGRMRWAEMRRRGWKRTVFFGVLFSGRMSFELVTALLPRYVECAKKRGTGVEVLFHPGYIEESEPFLDPFKTSFQEFYLSEGRRIEYNALMKLKPQEGF